MLPGTKPRLSVISQSWRPTCSSLASYVTPCLTECLWNSQIILWGNQIYKTHPFYENKSCVPVKNMITHLPTHNKEHTIDTNCKYDPDSKFLELSTHTTMVYSHGLQSISMPYLYFKKHKLLYTIKCNIL